MKILRQQVVPSRHTLPLENVIVTNWRKRARWSTIEFSWGLITMQFWIWYFSNQSCTMINLSSSSCSSSPPGSWPTLAEVLECRSMPVIGLQSRTLPPSHHTAHCTHHTAHCTNQTSHFQLHTAHCTGRTNWLYTQHSVISILAHFLPPHSQNNTVHSVHTSCYHSHNWQRI